MTQSSLEEKIIKSTSWNSLLAERQVSDILAKHKWHSVHSSYYADPDTNKLREIDVVARQTWVRKGKNTNNYAQLAMVIECKSAAGYHVITSTINEPKWATPHKVWIGMEDEFTLPITKALVSAGLCDDEITKVLNIFKKKAYPNQVMKGRSLVIDPLPAPFHTCGYRETNLGSEKELDNSVVWKAHLTLSSTLRSMRDGNIDIALADLPLFVEGARRHKLDVVQEAVDHLLIGLSIIYLYHPVIVVDAPIWAINNDLPQRIGWCRFHRQSAYGHSDWWFDLVNSEAFPSYANDTTLHYAKAFRHARAALDKT